MGQVSPLPLFEVDLMRVWPWPLAVSTVHAFGVQQQK